MNEPTGTMDHPTGADRAIRDMAYLAALMVWLIEHKDDHEADAEIADILNHQPYFTSIVINVLEAHANTIPNKT